MEEFSSGIRRALAEAAGMALTPVAEHASCCAAWLNALRDDDYHVSFSSLLISVRLLGYDDWFEQQCSAALGPPPQMLATLFGGRLDARMLDIARACVAAGHWPDEDWPNAAEPGPVEGVPWPRRAGRGELSASAARLLRYAGNRARSRSATAIETLDLIAAYVLDPHGHERQLESYGFDLPALRTAFAAYEAAAAAAARSAPQAGARHPLVRLHGDDAVRYVLRHAANLALGARQHTPPILTLRQILYALLEAGDDEGPVTSARALRLALGEAYRPGLGDEVAAGGTRPAWPPAPFAADETLPAVYAEVASVLDRAARWAGDDAVDLPALALALAAEPSEAAGKAFSPLRPLTQIAIRELWRDALHAESAARGADPVRIERWLYGEPVAAPAGVLPDLARPVHAGDDCLGVGRYALALAATAIARDTAPPLAIGVFGDWGAGKSYFMGLMELEMRKLAGGSDARFHRQVLPVWFNAWHYADANLWASLMQTLLEAIDAHVNADAHLIDADDLARLRTALDLAVQFRAEAGAASSEAQRALQSAQESAAQQNGKLDTARREAATCESTLDAARQTAFRAGLEWLAGQLRTADTRADQPPVAALADGFAVQARALGLTGLADSAGQLAGLSAATGTGLTGLRTLLADARVQAARTRSGFDWLLSTPLGIQPWQFALGSLGLLGLAAGLYLAAARWLPAGGFPTLGALSVLLGGTLTPALAWAKARLAAVHDALDQLDALRSGLDTGLAQAIEADPGVQRARSALEAARAAESTAQSAAADARQRLADAEQRVAATGEALRAQLRSERLGDYLRTRLATDDYRGQLGLVATIRRDLNRLAAFLEPPDWALDAARRTAGAIPDPATVGDAAPPSARAEEIAAVASLCAAGIPLRSRPLDRIVLYIDDLDRCPPERVVEVLEAVHLLLALPLFVVVVGVDVRWVSAALCRRYRGLLVGERDRAGEARMHPTATPTDYLEKIFQIPFRLPAIDTVPARRLLGTLIGKRLPAGISADAASGPGASSSAVSRQGAPAAEQPMAGAMPDTGQSSSDPVPADARPPQAVTEGSEPGAANAGISSVDATTDPVSMDARSEVGAALDIGTDESAFMGKLLDALGGSPRRVRRYVNSYRVYKVALRPAERDELLAGGGYREVLAALALQIGLGHRLAAVRQAAGARPGGGEDPRAWLTDCRLDPVHAARITCVLDALTAPDDAADAECRRLLHLLGRPDISRFSFAPTVR